MPSLADTQALFRRAVAGGRADAVRPLLKASGDPLERLEIYRRHYRESLRRHLRGRYPTIEWLLGTDRMIELADALVVRLPPRAPSLAEYGGSLADLLADQPDEQFPWLADVARLDWQLGVASVAVEREPRGIAALAAVPPHRLPDVRLTLQSGLAYLDSGWPIDRLVHLRLGGAAPDRLQFGPEPVRLELSGGRGRFALDRLDPPTAAFRRALRSGRALADASERALVLDRAFDLSAALARLFAEGRVTELNDPQEIRHD